MSAVAEKILVVTGSLVAPTESSYFHAARKLLLQWRASEAAWLDLKVKCVGAEPIVAAALERLRLRSRMPANRQAVESYFAHRETVETPELTEVVLTTLLHELGMPYLVSTYEELFARPRLREKLLAQSTCVFASTTLLRDLSEVEPVVRLLKRSHNRIVLGGALAGILARDWRGMPEVDILAVGYGEILVAPLVSWIRNGYQDLRPPARGRIERRGNLVILHSGVPETKDLDFLVRPDWALSARDRGRRYRLIHYESERGCPYRCAFCNYPFLFDDTRFRFKSARKIVDDWEHYASDLGVEYISCLDSLFTMPRSRLRELCGLLVGRRLKVKWVCYARADDLAEMETARMMREAGCSQVQIGLESGSQAILDSMNKRCTVEKNLHAIHNCRKVGITSVVTLIVGFPGETPDTLQATYRLMEAARPDFHFLATFSTRVAGVPVLQKENRERFGLTAMSNPRTVAPYWAHRTMSCTEVGNHVRAMNYALAENRVSLDAAIFYAGILSYRPELGEQLLDFQYRAVTHHNLTRRFFDTLNRWVDGRLRADAARWLAVENGDMNDSLSTHEALDLSSVMKEEIEVRA